MKTYTSQQKAKVTKEYRKSLSNMLSNLTIDDETDNFYHLSVDKDLYDTYAKAEEKAMRYGVTNL